MNSREHSNLLKGAYDIHVHCAPDVVRRAQSPIELAEDALRAGMAGVGIKDHTTSTAATACVLNETYADGPHFFSALALNPPVGGLNPVAVEAALREGVDIIYLPTYGARHHMETLGPGPFPVPDGFEGITILDEAGVIRKDVRLILSLIAEYDALLATGHLSPEESLILLEKARESGVRRMLVTHASEPVTSMSVARQSEAVRHGAFIEHSFLAVTETCGCSFTLEEMWDQIRQVGVERVILSSDLGQVANGPPVQGFSRFVERLLAIGVTKDAMHLMISKNPRRLLEDRDAKLPQTA